MKRVLKVVGGIAVVLALVIGVGWMLLPSTYGVSRTIEVNASAPLTFDLVNDLTAWEDWSPWAAMDPEMKVTYGDKSVGEGASYSWTGPETGTGTLTILKSTPPTRIETQVDFGAMGISQGSWDFESNGNTTTVTWSFEGELPFSMRPMGLMTDSMLGPQFEEGLGRIKELAEARSPCELMDRFQCTKSEACVLVAGKDMPEGWSHAYGCREASGPCEEGINANLREPCEARAECAFGGGSCYCPFPGYGQTAVPDPSAKGGACVCGGGPPNRCYPKAELPGGPPAGASPDEANGTPNDADAATEEAAAP